MDQRQEYSFVVNFRFDVSEIKAYIGKTVQITCEVKPITFQKFSTAN